MINQYDLYKLIAGLFDHPKGLYLRRASMDHGEYVRIRANLKNARVIANDPDYGARAYRITALGDLPAEDIGCLVDPFAYISHLSAMQRYGLTNRRPDALHLSRQDEAGLKQTYPAAEADAPSRILHHPVKLRGRRLHIHNTRNPAAAVELRNSQARIAPIGRCFHDMLTDPALCGGMAHVVATWQQHGRLYLEEIVAEIEANGEPISKVRAGHILDERLGICHPVVQQWHRFAQRGGSRKLDPDKPYGKNFSKKWMLGLNA